MPHGHTGHIHTEPCTHARHVRSSDLPRMDRIKKLSAHVERAGMATGVPNDGRILKAERDMFSKVEGGDELYQLLCEIFKVNEK